MHITSSWTLNLPYHNSCTLSLIGWVGEENSLGDLQVHGEPAASLARLAPKHQSVLLTCKSLFSPFQKSLGEQRCMESLQVGEKSLKFKFHSSCVTCSSTGQTGARAAVRAGCSYAWVVVCSHLTKPVLSTQPDTRLSRAYLPLGKIPRKQRPDMLMVSFFYR